MSIVANVPPKASAPVTHQRPVAVKPKGWNHYRILCEGPRIRMWLNGVACADYTEKDPKIPLDGHIGLQVHGGGTLTVQFKDITVQELAPTKGAPSWADPGRKIAPWPRSR